MRHKHVFTLTLFLFSFFYSHAQYSVKGFYVNDFKNIIGDEVAENELLTFAQSEGFNYLLLYNLHHIHTQMFDITDPLTALPLSQFIEKAKTQYGIIEVGGVGEKFASFDKMKLYNATHASNANQLIDVFHLEFEFWNSNFVENYYCDTYLEDWGYACTKTGAFEFYLEQLIQLNTLAENINIKSETYVGNPTNSQCQSIGQNVQRALIHYYRKSDVYNNGNSIYNYKKYRLPQLAPSTGVLDVLPVFSSRSYHMGPWLLNHPEEQAIGTWLYGQNGFEEDTGSWKDHVNVVGYQWYRYSDLEYYMENGTANLQVFEDDSALTSGESTSKNIIFPNPTTEVLNVNLSNSQQENVTIYNALGREVWTSKILGSTILDVSGWERGIYFLRMKDDCYKVVLK